MKGGGSVCWGDMKEGEREGRMVKLRCIFNCTCHGVVGQSWASQWTRFYPGSPTSGGL